MKEVRHASGGDTDIHGPWYPCEVLQAGSGGVHGRVKRFQLGEVMPELTVKRLTGCKFIKGSVKDIPGWRSGRREAQIQTDFSARGRGIPVWLRRRQWCWMWGLGKGWNSSYFVRPSILPAFHLTCVTNICCDRHTFSLFLGTRAKPTLGHIALNLFNEYLLTAYFPCARHSPGSWDVLPTHPPLNELTFYWRHRQYKTEISNI